MAALSGDEAAKKRISPRDGRKRATIVGAGARLSITRHRGTRGGAITVDTLPAGLDPTAFANPGFKTPTVNDSARLAFVVKAVGLTITPDDWAKVVGADLRDHAAKLTALSDDPNRVAAALREVLHDRARVAETEAVDIATEAKALRISVEGVVLDVEPVEDLRKAEESAIEALAAAKASGESARAAAESRTRAEESLAALEGTLPDVKSLEADRKDALAAKNTAIARRDSLHAATLLAERAESEALRERETAERAESEAVRAMYSASNGWTASDVAVGTAERQHDRAAELRRTILASEGREWPSDEELSKLAIGRETARQRVAGAENAKTARIATERAKVLDRDAEFESTKAADLRSRAHSTDDVLTAALVASGVSDIFPVDERLYVPADDRAGGRELVDDLSQTELDELAIRLASRGLGPGGIMQIEQAAWSSMLPDRREAIHRFAVEHDITIYTARATEGPLRIESTDEDKE